jgi:prevent-host-death family protein
MAKVTSGDFTREFGRYRVMAHREPVVVTNHGRDDVVLIGAEDYARLRRYEQKAFHVSQLPKEVVDELGTVAIPKAAAAFNDEYQP